jgi:LmbE family N-acetylglucosaminyl deacetylase
MEIKSTHKGQSITTVVVTGAGTDFPANHERATTFAMAAVGETPERLMDWDTDEYEAGTVTVKMYKQ